MDRDYDKTLNLPSTEFPMRAGLPTREPEALKAWNEENLYAKLMEHNEGKPLYILHDGPPYANGIIHLGTALNKSLKDFVVRYKNMSGFKSPYVPGYDTHGLPTELKARNHAGKEQSERATPLQLRKICRDFANRFADEQRVQFERLGVLGEWNHPYKTLTNDYVARQIEVFGAMAEKGYIYKGLKPVYWCPECQTALAEAEIEYGDDACDSIYVKFPVTGDMKALEDIGAVAGKTSFVIWTTTTWTLPANLAICLGPEYDYCVVKANDEYYVMARELVENTMSVAEITDYEILGSTKGADLEYLKVRHPFIDRESLVILGNHVTLESGTGCVHTAPGHGVDDFEVCRRYEIKMVVPVDSKGVLTEEAGRFAGLTTDKANKSIAAWLSENGYLFALKKIVHPYPHCWRCNSPILFRATPQWFCSISDFARETQEAIKSVKWVPGWGEDRIAGMVRDRSDWCISRQRIWGVPLPIFYCKACGKEIITSETIKKIAAVFREKGSDAWYELTEKELLPDGFKCHHCGSEEFTKECDIMDVWFDSGVSHAAVLEQREDLRSPADMYLEGADQYRGWFQSSLLTSVAMYGRAPYKTVVTHGWVVDGDGRKMSKSEGNVIIPDDVVNKYGADILRLWVASSDYHADIRVSNDILKQLSEVYRKIRNTARFILSNLGDFNPDTDSVEDSALEEIDRWALARLDELVGRCTEAYENYEYHLIYHAVHNFCVVDMSNFYLDVLKDRLYVEAPKSATRRAAQTAIYTILDTLTRLVAPILAFTADEIWQFMPHKDGCDTRNVVFNDIPKAKGNSNEAFMARWDQIHALREDVKKALEEARNAKIIGAPLDAAVTLYAEGDLYDFICGNRDLLKTVFIVSGLELVKGTGGDLQGETGVGVSVAKAAGEKCCRCWAYSEGVGSNPEHEGVCERCAGVLDEINKA